MFLLSLALVCSASFAAQRPEQKSEPDPKAVAAAVTEIETALKDAKTSDEKVAAIKKNTGLVDPKVVGAIEKGLKDKDVAVQAAAADALGRMPQADSLEALHRFYKSEVKRLKDDQTLMPVVIKAIGRLGSEKSIDLLSDDLFAQRTFPAVQARLLGLGNIRSKKSIDALFGMMNKVGTNQLDTYMEPVRLALMRLTGTDQGPSSQSWMAWWRGAEKTFEMPKEAKLPEAQEKVWNDYWEIQPKKEAAKGGEEKKAPGGK
jgi:PBS lyase HEAT-like repeat